MPFVSLSTETSSSGPTAGRIVLFTLGHRDGIGLGGNVSVLSLKTQFHNYSDCVLRGFNTCLAIHLTGF